MKRFLSALGWVCVGLAVFGLCLRAADLRGVVPLVQGAWVGFAVGAVVLALVAAPTRRPWFTLVCGTLALTYLAVLVPAVLPRTVVARDDDLVVLTVDLDRGQGDLEAVAQAARARSADVIVLLEVTPAALESLDAGSLPTQFPTRVGRARADAGGALILSREDMDVVSLDQNDIGFDQPTVTLHHNGQDVTLRAVHARPPTVEGSRQWRSSLWWIQKWREAQPEDRPLVMAGDLSSSDAHPAFRDLAAGMTDAQRCAGQGWRGTWPANRFVPVATVDHVLVRGLPVVDAGTFGVPRSDHMGVWARLRVG